MLAYEWHVSAYTTHGNDGLAKHSGLTDSETVAVRNVESIMRKDPECAMGVVYPVLLVYSAVHTLSYEWTPLEHGKQQLCTRTVRGGNRWSDAKSVAAIAG